MSDASILTQLSACDTELLKANKSLEDLPEAAQIMECRAKRKELKSKQDQVYDLTDEVNDKIEKLQAEETQIIEKLKDLQNTLDHTKDFRVTSSVTRDMEGLVKRQGNISLEIDGLLERQIKIDNLAAQLNEMLGAVDHKEHHLTEDFKEKGGKIKARIETLKMEHDQLIAQLPGSLATKYEKLRKEKGGVGVGFLKNGICTACHSQLQPGQLAKVKGQTVTECPNCHRVFVTETEE